MKVKFCSHGYTYMAYQDRYVSINPAWLYIQKWYELHGLNPNIEWLPPGILAFGSPDEIISQIVKEQPNILGLGVYIWNESLQLLIAKEVKSLLPDTIIVGGGPQLIAHKDEGADFFKQHPYFDYIVYGDGEEPFQQIIDYHSNILLLKDSFVNVVENIQTERKIYPYKMINDESYLSTSPFVSQEQHMIEIRDMLVEKGVPLTQQMWLMEFARGCMYSCTFCDWGQNLTKKVKRRSHDWREDIDLFCRLNVPLGITDANFGQWKDDIVAYDYAASLYDPNRTFRFAASCTSKLKKEASEYIMINNALLYDMSPVIALQDMNDEVLIAVDRPSISWEKTVEMIGHLREVLPPEKFRKTWFQTIVGLPSQTLDSLAEQLVEFFNVGVINASYDAWVLLPNSPAADPNYQRLWGIKVMDVYKNFAYDARDHVDDLGKLYQEVRTTTKYVNTYAMFKGVIGTRTMSTIDIWAAHALIRKWDLANAKMNLLETRTTEQVRDIVNRLKLSCVKEAQNQWELHAPYIEKYNCIIWGAWNQKDQELYMSF